MRGTAAEAAAYQATVDERIKAKGMTPKQAVGVVLDHLAAVKRGEPEALAVDREVAKALAGKPADKTLPAGTAPAVAPCSVLLLGSLADATGSALRVERDLRDERHYITATFDGDERPVEVPPAVARGVAALLAGGIGTAGGASGNGKPVKQATAAVKTGTTDRPLSPAEVERASLLAQVVSLAGPLPVEGLRDLVQRLDGVSRALAWGDRMRLPARRRAVTRSAEVGGTKVHVGTNLDDAGEIRTVWIDVAKEGSPVRGLLHVIAGLASVALQHGAPITTVAKIMSEPEFDPRGDVTGAEDDGITRAHSIPHYVAQVLARGGR